MDAITSKLADNHHAEPRTGNGARRSSIGWRSLPGRCAEPVVRPGTRRRRYARKIPFARMGVGASTDQGYVADGGDAGCETDGW